DPEIAEDAYLEFARATDQEVGHIASKLSADKLRRLVQSPTTPPDRIGLFSFLLGACGSDRDAVALLSLIRNPTPQTAPGLSGLLSGYIQLRPREGWELALKMLGDANRPFPERFSVLRMLRFFHGWKPEQAKREILQCLAVVVPQGDLADLAIQDLRDWQYW